MGFRGRSSRIAGLLLLACVMTPLGSALGAPLQVSSKGIKRFARTPDNPTINYYLDPSVSSIASSIREGLQAWDDVSTIYLQFTEVSDEASAALVVTSGSTRNTEEFDFTFDSNGEITHVRWLLHDSAFQMSGSSLVAVMIHEAGHALGLRHSLNEGAIMSYRRSGASTLSLDDEFAITRLYPVDGEHDYPLGCASVGINRGGPPNDQAARWVEVIGWLILFGFFNFFRAGRSRELQLTSPPPNLR